MKALRLTLMVVAIVALAGSAMAQNNVYVDQGGAGAMNGTNYGLTLETQSGQTNNAFVEDQTPDAESTYRASFWIDPNAVTMGAWSRFAAFSGRATGNTEVIRFQLQRARNPLQFRIRMGCLNNAGVWKWAKENGTGQKALPIGDNPTFVTIETVWSGGNLGSCRMTAAGRDHWNDGYQSNLHNVNLVRLGGAKGISGDVAGDVYFDEFESFRTLAP